MMTRMSSFDETCSFLPSQAARRWWGGAGRLCRAGADMAEPPRSGRAREGCRLAGTFRLLIDVSDGSRGAAGVYMLRNQPVCARDGASAQLAAGAKAVVNIRALPAPGAPKGHPALEYQTGPWPTIAMCHKAGAQEGPCGSGFHLECGASSPAGLGPARQAPARAARGVRVSWRAKHTPTPVEIYMWPVRCLPNLRKLVLARILPVIQL